jgi:hypothetical protein
MQPGYFGDAGGPLPSFKVETKTYADGSSFTGTAPLPDHSPLADAPAFTGLTFGDALVALKGGAKVARTGWNGKGMFVFLVPGSQFTVNRAPLLGIYPEGTPITYRPHIDIKGADGSISTWVPSIGDVMAEDWLIVE